MRERERREWVPLQADRIGHMRAPAHELFGFDFDLETQKMNLKKIHEFEKRKTTEICCT